MKHPSSSAATLKFASPEISVGLEAAKKSKPGMKGAAKAAMGSGMAKGPAKGEPAMPQNKKLIMPGAPDKAPSAGKKMNPAKRLPKRKK